MNPSVTAAPCQLPQAGSLFTPGIVTAVEVGVSITFIKYHPKIKPSAYAPLAPSVTCGDSSLRSGAMGCVLFHIGLLQVGKCLLCNPSVAFGASSLWQGSLLAFPIYAPLSSRCRSTSRQMTAHTVPAFPARKSLAGSAHPRQVSVVFPAGNPEKKGCFCSMGTL